MYSLVGERSADAEEASGLLDRDGEALWCRLEASGLHAAYSHPDRRHRNTEPSQSRSLQFDPSWPSREGSLISMANHEVTSACRALVDNAPLLRHPFFQFIAEESDLAKRSLLRWLQLDWIVARDFTTLAFALGAVSKNMSVRHVLSRNLWDEFGNGKISRAHFTSYVALMRSVGADEPQGYSTSEFLELQRSICSRSEIEGLAVFCYANEYLCLAEFPPIAASFERNFPSHDRRYFRELIVDHRHTRELEDVLVSVCDGSEGEIRRLETALQAVLDAREAIYDEVTSSLA